MSYKIIYKKTMKKNLNFIHLCKWDPDIKSKLFADFHFQKRRKGIRTRLYALAVYTCPIYWYLHFKDLVSYIYINIWVLKQHLSVTLGFFRNMKITVSTWTPSNHMTSLLHFHIFLYTLPPSWLISPRTANTWYHHPI